MLGPATSPRPQRPRGRQRCPAAPALLGPQLRAAAPGAGARRRASSLLTPQPRFIPGTGRGRPASPPAGACALTPSPELPRWILRERERRIPEPAPSRGVPAPERDGDDGRSGRGEGSLTPRRCPPQAVPERCSPTNRRAVRHVGQNAGSPPETSLPAFYPGETTAL
ncbi:putative gap junction epsilon-1 protein isoform X2 [Pseudopipra pipra]|uniref:putative gap junction epsilon-1 protein isoform X2 n=1 Tax=Pseudopipra pipra TaxID=415032 RepID=UPI003139F190